MISVGAPSSTSETAAVTERDSWKIKICDNHKIIIKALYREGGGEKVSEGAVTGRAKRKEIDKVREQKNKIEKVGGREDLVNYLVEKSFKSRLDLMVRNNKS